MADTLVTTIPKTRPDGPSVINQFANGHAPASLLRVPGDGRGQLLILPSYGMQALILAGIGQGHFIGSTGRNRTAERQWDMLHERYVFGVRQQSGGDTNYVPAHTWRGQHFAAGFWYLKRGFSPCAIPETSNHGLARADDVATILDDGDLYLHATDTGDRIVGLTDRDLIWFRDNASLYGWALESWIERWHWHWRGGDVLTDDAIAVLQFCGVPIHIPGYMDWDPDDGAQPAPGPLPPLPPDVPTDIPFDPDNGVYGLYPLNPAKDHIGTGTRGELARYAQAILRLEVSRYARFYLARGDWLGAPDPEAQRAKLANVVRFCEALTIDGWFGDQSATAMAWYQDCFGDTKFDGRYIPDLRTDGQVDDATWASLDELADHLW